MHATLLIYLLAPPVIQAQPGALPLAPIVQAQPCIPPQVADIQNTVIAVPNPTTPSHKCPARIPNFTSSNAVFLVPDHIKKKKVRRRLECTCSLDIPHR